MLAILLHYKYLQYFLTQTEQVDYRVLPPLNFYQKLRQLTRIVVTKRIKRYANALIAA